jgi:hypothetical protein
MMAKRLNGRIGLPSMQKKRPAPFKGQHFKADVIILCARRFP